MGLFERNKAIFFAKNRGYDLALVAENANPPTAKLIDYGKYKYDQEKAIKKQKKKKEGLKEVRLSAKISFHDLEIKAKKAEKFLEKGYNVKVNVRLRGREMQFKNSALELIDRFAEIVKDKGDMEIKPFQERNQFFAQFKPKK